MKPWFNTTLIVMLTLIWIVIGWQLHQRLATIEMINKVQQHDSWHKNKQ
jgi:hypothetical protein